MRRNCHMSTVDLGDLQVLLILYQQTYGGVDQCLLEQVEQRYQERLEKAPPGGRYSQKNPRGAGRKRSYREEDRALALDLHSKGISIRKISEQTGIPKSSVQKLITGHKPIDKQKS